MTYWPAEYRQWARERGLDGITQAGSRASSRPAAEPARAASGHVDGSPREPAPVTPLAIVSPPDGATYLIDPTLRREFQTLPLRATSAGGGPVEWRVSGRVVGAAAVEAGLEWPLAPGTHRIEARDTRGRTSEATIVVR